MSEEKASFKDFIVKFFPDLAGEVDEFIQNIPDDYNWLEECRLEAERLANDHTYPKMELNYGKILYNFSSQPIIRLYYRESDLVKMDRAFIDRFSRKIYQYTFDENNNYKIVNAKDPMRAWFLEEILNAENRIKAIKAKMENIIAHRGDYSDAQLEIELFICQYKLLVEQAHFIEKQHCTKQISKKQAQAQREELNNKAREFFKRVNQRAQHFVGVDVVLPDWWTETFKDFL